MDQGKLPNAAEHIKKKLPSMYHQFMQLAGIDITKEPMEIGPTTHYIMGGVRVEGDSQMSSVPGLFACGECAAGLHGANRLGGNSLSDLLVFGKRAGEYAARFARDHGASRVNTDDADAAARVALAPFERTGSADGPYQVQETLQENMQDLVGIVRTEHEMEQALACIDSLKRRAAAWPFTVIANTTLVGIPRSISTTCSLLPKRSRARPCERRVEGHFRDDFPTRIRRLDRSTVVQRDGDGQMRLSPETFHRAAGAQGRDRGNDG